MGIVYHIKCTKCHSHFTEWAGMGLLALPFSGNVTENADSPFSCPFCENRINPTSPDFEEQVESENIWEV